MLLYLLQDLIPPTPAALAVHVDTFIFEVSKIDDISLTMTFELYMDLTWQETRLVINETSPMWGPDDSYMGSTNFVKSMWLPDIQELINKQLILTARVIGLYVHSTQR